MPAQIRENQPVARIERCRYRIPESVMTRKRMEQDDRRTVPANFIENLGVVAVQGRQGVGSRARGASLGWLEARHLLASNRLLRSRHRKQQRLLWNDDPSKNIRDDSREDSATERDEEPEDAHERHIELEIVSQTGANTADFPVRSRTHQLLRHRHHPHHVAAVRAKAPIFSDSLAASVAVHGCHPLFMIRRQRRKCSGISFWLLASGSRRKAKC